jgi:D-serine deaminase-like pyridoxal phosphate-dependent protein
MAMSRDRGTQKRAQDYGYGQVCDASGKWIDGYVLTGANQEHGILSRTDAKADVDISKLFPVGSQLRILPNHACATGAQFPNIKSCKTKKCRPLGRAFTVGNMGNLQ